MRPERRQAIVAEVARLGPWFHNLHLPQDMRAAKPVLCSGPVEEISVRGIARLILKQTGSKSPITYLPLPEDDPRRRQPSHFMRDATIADGEHRFHFGNGVRVSFFDVTGKHHQIGQHAGF